MNCPQAAHPPPRILNTLFLTHTHTHPRKVKHPVLPPASLSINLQLPHGLSNSSGREPLTLSPAELDKVIDLGLVYRPQLPDRCSSPVQSGVTVHSPHQSVCHIIRGRRLSLHTHTHKFRFFTYQSPRKLISKPPISSPPPPKSCLPLLLCNHRASVGKHT